MFKEFKSFAIKGNVVDLAVGVIIGSAFGKIVSSFVDDIVTPVLSLITGKVDFSNLFVVLSGHQAGTLADTRAAGAITLNYGTFISTVINFLIVAFAIFLMIRQINKWRTAPSPTTRPCPFCKMPIDLQATRCPHCTSQLSTQA